MRCVAFSLSWSFEGHVYELYYSDDLLEIPGFLHWASRRHCCNVEQRRLKEHGREIHDISVHDKVTLLFQGHVSTKTALSLSTHEMKESPVYITKELTTKHLNIPSLQAPCHHNLRPLLHIDIERKFLPNNKRLLIRPIHRFRPQLKIKIDENTGENQTNLMPCKVLFTRTCLSVRDTSE